MRIDSSRLHDLAEPYTSAWCGNDPTGVAAFYSPNGSLRVNSADPAVGRDAIAEVAQGFMTAFPDLKLTMDDLIIEGDRAVYHWTFAGTNTGPSGGGQRVLFSGYEIWEIGADCLIAESRGHFDEASFQRQLIHGID
jgi:predicted ester cyclase